MVVPFDSGNVISSLVRVPSHGDPESDSMLLNLGNVSSLAARENVRSTLPTVLLGPKQKNPTLNATGGRMNSPTMVTATKRKLTSTSTSSSSSSPLAKSRRINSGTNCYSPSTTTTTHTPTPSPTPQMLLSSSHLEIKNLLPQGPLVSVETAYGQMLLPIQSANGQPLQIVYLDSVNQTLMSFNELMQQRNEFKKQNMEFQNQLRLFTQLFNDKKRLCHVVERLFPDIEFSTKRI